MELTLSERKALIKVFAKKYLYGTKKEKAFILDEFVELTGFNRNYAARVLRNYKEGVRKKQKKKSGRHKYYDENVNTAIEKIWETLDYICSKRLVTALPAIINKLEQFREIKLDKTTKKKLLKISASTIERILKQAKKRLGRKTTSTTRQPRYLIDKIPIKTFGEWQDTPVGFTQLDLVAHNGGNVFGGFFYTLTTTDICTTWTNCILVKNKTKLQMLKSLINMRKSFPFPIKGVHSDNGAEFINETVFTFTEKYNIEFTRGRPYKKNDNPHIEQKNCSVLRRNTGYLRYDKPDHMAILKDLYSHLNLYVNYFLPTMVLIEKHRVGAKSVRKYDKPKTPYQRLLEISEVPSSIKKGIRKIYKHLNPVELKRKINECQRQLIQSAAPFMKPEKPIKIRRRKEIKHTLPKGRRNTSPAKPNPFLERERIEKLRKNANLVWSER